jgi:hypothetical protein
MSLVIAFAGTVGAVVCGDRREIRFYEGGDVETLECELYGGSIRTDSELMERSARLGVYIEIRDNKEKVFTSASGSVLVGAVTSYSREVEQQRRMYITPGGHLIAEIVDGRVRVSEIGGSVLLVFGNEVTKRMSNEAIGRYWDPKRSKKLSDVVLALMQVMDSVSQKTASISRAYSVMQVPPLPKGVSPANLLRKVLEQDMKQNHWRML